MNAKTLYEVAFIAGGCLMFGTWSFISCGSQGGKDVVIVQPEEPKPVPVPGEPTTPGTPKPPVDEWETVIKPIVTEQCALSGCHAGAKFLNNGEAMRASKSLQVVSNGRMPKLESPNYDLWTDAKKAKLIAYLSSSK